jgi:sulfotransferase family protein
MKRIAIHSVPRSGSSWLSQVFNSSPTVNFKFQPLFSYAFKNYLNENSSLEEINNFFQNIAKSDDEFLNQTEQIKKGSYPIFKKNDTFTHIIYKEVRYNHIIKNLLEKDSEIKVIGIVRNPLAVINSWWKAPKEFRKEKNWNILEEWKTASKKNENKKEEFNGFEKWKEIAILFEELKIKYPNQFYLIEYRYLIENPVATIEKLFHFCEIPFEEATIDFINASTTNRNHENDAYSIYRNIGKEDKGWENELPQIIIETIFFELKETILEKYLI